LTNDSQSQAEELETFCRRERKRQAAGTFSYSIHHFAEQLFETLLMSFVADQVLQQLTQQSCAGVGHRSAFSFVLALPQSNTQRVAQSSALLQVMQ
jgi:hypothetical protein